MNNLRGGSLERSKRSILRSNDSWTNESLSVDDSVLGSFEVKTNVPMDFFKSWDKFLEPNPTPTYHKNVPNPNSKIKSTRPKLRRVRSRSFSDIEPISKPNPILTNPYVSPTATKMSPIQSAGPIELGLPVTETTISENNIHDSSIPDSGKHLMSPLRYELIELVKNKNACL